MRDDENLEQSISEIVRVSQIIVAAMVTGTLLFAGVVLTVFVDHEEVAENGVMSSVGLVLGLFALMAQSVVSKSAANAGVRGWMKRGGESLAALAPIHQVKTIIAAAICEGAAFVNLIFYGFLDPSPWLLAMAGLLILATATKFPTVGGVADWCRRQARSARENAALRRAD